MSFRELCRQWAWREPFALGAPTVDRHGLRPRDDGLENLRFWDVQPGCYRGLSNAAQPALGLMSVRFQSSATKGRRVAGWLG